MMRMLAGVASAYMLHTVAVSAAELCQEMIQRKKHCAL